MQYYKKWMEISQNVLCFGLTSLRTKSQALPKKIEIEIENNWNEENFGSVKVIFFLGPDLERWMGVWTKRGEDASTTIQILNSVQFSYNLIKT